jgi:RsiW-degrading membrane proteinase PrsW (M82 family)
LVPQHIDQQERWWLQAISGQPVATNTTTQFIDELLTNPEAMFDVVDELRFLQSLDHPAFQVPTTPLESLSASPFDPTVHAFRQQLLEAQSSPDLTRAALLALASPSDQPSPELLLLSQQKPIAPYVHWAVALCWSRHDAVKASAAAEAEWQAFPAATDRDGARRLAVTLSIDHGDAERLRHLLRDERTRAATDPLQRADIAWMLHDYPTWAIEVGLDMFRWWELDLALVALASFFTWVITISLASRLHVPIWLPVAGLALGTLSIWPTLLTYKLQHHFFPMFDQQDSLMTTVRFAVLSVGLREEVCKLLCVLPLLPWLRGQAPLMWLIAGSMVGLGFAWEENINYFGRSLGGAVSGRLLTANFLHLSLTGMATYGLCLVLWHRRTHAEQGLRYLIFSVLIHGIWDTATCPVT